MKKLALSLLLVVLSNAVSANDFNYGIENDFNSGVPSQRDGGVHCVEDAQGRIICG